MRLSSFSGALTALPLLFGTVQAGCDQVGIGPGNNPLKCKSYSIPKDIGQSVTVGLQTLTIGRTDGQQNPFGGDWFWYDFKNEVNYQVNFAVQFWNAKTNGVWPINYAVVDQQTEVLTIEQNFWKSYSLAPGEKCHINFVSTLQNVKLTC